MYPYEPMPGRGGRSVTKRPFRWRVWPTHFKTIWQEYGADGSAYDIDYSQYGQDHHCGVDIKSGLYGEVMAVAAGTVQSIKYAANGLGLYITVQHTDRFGTVYAHLSRVFVQEGDTIAPGQVIAWSGWTGNTVGAEQHLHVGQIDWINGDKGCFGKYTDPAPYYRHLLQEDPCDGPAGPHLMIDMLPYLCGDGRAYFLEGSLGREVCWTDTDDKGRFYQVKNAQWEELWHDDAFIYRGLDTSPGQNRFYVHDRLNGTAGAPWIKRHMLIGEEFTSCKSVRFFDKETCRQLSEHDVTDTIKLVAHYQSRHNTFGFGLDDVIELKWMQGGEVYYYAKNHGLVGWKSSNGTDYSAYAGPTDEKQQREKIKCHG